MPTATSSETATHADRDKSVFSVDMQALQSLQHIQKKPELVQTNNTAVLAKFCDVCKRLNLDPLHAQALPCVVLLMSKNKHCVEMAHCPEEALFFMCSKSMASTGTLAYMATHTGKYRADQLLLR